MISLTNADAAAIDRDLAAQQVGPHEPELVGQLATAWTKAVGPMVQARAPGRPVLVGDTVVHMTPIVAFGTKPNPELGDLLLVTGYVRAGVLHRGRAVLFQAKGPRTPLPPHQEHLYTSWPVFEIISPKVPHARWDVGPEGAAVPPSRRGAAFLRVQNRTVPQRYEIGRARQQKSLGECTRAMLRCRYSRAFARVDPSPTGTNSWDQLITYLLMRTCDPTLRSLFGALPNGFPKQKKRRPGSGVVTSLDTSPSSRFPRSSQRPKDEENRPRVIYALVVDEDDERSGAKRECTRPGMLPSEQQGSKPAGGSIAHILDIGSSKA